ncbi:ABC transporter ATP-binding protein [Nocardioides astragali]|uniref:ABC transporter ATP-binding protein n=1 Tax=Nocardioides astragali TaxID=1776736 RepID=A0ABW2N9X0_9ACTN|nr:ABC transporter ATP-binding protein [Nocardioides astragali]
MDETQSGEFAPTSVPRTEVLLQVDHLEVSFEQPAGRPAVRGVKDVSFSIAAGETLGLVGESGCGKTMSALAVMGLLPAGAAVTGGAIMWRGTAVDARQIRRLRGRSIAMIPQDAMTALNPLLSVQRQLTEVMKIHHGMGRAAARARAIELLELVRIDEPRRVAVQHPWQLSGGMAQRVVIAMALAAEPDLLVADEPTTALDVTVQSEILALLQMLQADLGLSLIMITHDLGVVAHLAHRTAVMYAGRIVETGPTKRLFHEPAHPYTRGLIASTPHPFRVEATKGIPGQAPLALLDDPACSFRSRCEKRTEVCETRPELKSYRHIDHEAACHHAG